MRHSLCPSRPGLTVLAVVVGVVLALASMMWRGATASAPLAPPLEQPARELGGPRSAILDVPGGGPGRVPVEAPAFAGATGAGPRDALVVRLRDPGGTPLDGVWVGFKASAPAPSQPQGRTEVTDAQGEVRLSNLDVQALFARGADGRLVVTCLLDLPGLAPTRTLAQHALPEEPIEVIVDVVPVWIGALLPGGDAFQGRHGVVWRYDERGSYGSTAGESPVRVWLAREEAVSVEVTNAGLYANVRQGLEPIRVGERERVHNLQLGATTPGLRATLLRPDGAPLAVDTSVELRARRVDSRGDGSSVDAGGRVQFRLPPAQASGQRRTLWFVVGAEGAAGYGRWRRSVTFTVPADGEWVELGEVTLDAEPLVVAGHVVLPAEVPSDRVAVVLEWVNPEGCWASVPDLGNCVWVDDDGAFAIFGPAPEGPSRVSVILSLDSDLEDFVACLPPTIAVGTADLVIPIVRTGTVRFRVEGEDIRDRDLEVVVAPEHGSPQRTLDASEVHDLLEQEAGECLLRRLPPGHVTVTLRAEPGGAALGCLERIAVVPGATTDGGTLRRDAQHSWLELSVTSASYGPTSAIVRYGPAGGPLALRAEASDGVARLAWDGSSALDAAVGADGHRPVLVSGVRESRAVVLTPQPIALVHLVGIRALVDRLGADAVGRSLAVRFHRSERSPFEGLGELAFTRRRMRSVRFEADATTSSSTSLELEPGPYTVDAAILPSHTAAEDWIGPEYGAIFLELGAIDVAAEPPNQAFSVDVRGLID